MELIKDFGIDPVLLAAQGINFLIVLFILKRFLYKPLVSLLRKRQNNIKTGVKNAEDAQKRLEKVIEEEKVILKKAQTNAKKIIDDATKQSLEISQEIQENSKKQAEKILTNAKNQIEKDARETEKRLSLNIGNLAVKFLEKSLTGLFSEQDQKEVMKKALKKIKI